MARIFNFPVRPRVKQQAAPVSQQVEQTSIWRDIWGFPPLYIVLLLVMTFCLTCWPLILWGLAIDLIYQFFCMIFLSGWRSFTSFLHLLFLGMFAYALLVLIPRKRK